MKTILKSLIASTLFGLITLHTATGQVVQAKPQQIAPLASGNTNQLATTVSSVQLLGEMLQQLPADLPNCAQNFDTFGVLATEHVTSTNPPTGFYSANSLAFKRGGQLTFDLNRTPAGNQMANTGWLNYRVFVENGQVCVSRNGIVLARNIQVIKLSPTTYSLSWYTQFGVVSVSFLKKKDSIIC